MFNNRKKKFEELIKSERYKNSKYEFQKVNGQYAIKNKNTGDYVDLISFGFEWPYGSRHIKDCFGDISDLLRVFDFLHPIIEPINIEEIF